MRRTRCRYAGLGVVLSAGRGYGVRVSSRDKEGEMKEASMIEFKVRIERTDSDEGWCVTITTLPTEGALEPAPPQVFYGDGIEWTRDLLHDWMVDNVQ